MNTFLKYYVFIIFVCIFKTVIAIKCWECRSDFDPACGEPFNNATLAITDCNMHQNLEYLPGISPTMCRLIIQKIFNETRYIRNCAYLGEVTESSELNCRTREGSFNIFVQYCTCKTDGCNG